MVAPILERTIEPCLNAMKDARICHNKIKHVILVGGMTRMPLIKRIVQNIFKRTPDDSVNPDEVVAKGAAIQAGIIEGELKDLVLLDVNSLSLGIETVGGIFNKIIKRNSTLPTKQTEMFTTSEDNQTEVEIKIYQGERPLVKHNKYLGEIKLKGISPMKKGQPLIEVTFEGDSNGIFNVTARDTILNKELKMEIKPASGLDKNEIERIISEAVVEEEADKKRIECAKLRCEIERLGLNKIEGSELSDYVKEDIYDTGKVREMIDRLISN